MRFSWVRYGLIGGLIIGTMGVWMWMHRHRDPPRNTRLRGGPVYHRSSSLAGLSKNKLRIYDFYAKQAIRYLEHREPEPDIIPPFIGLDGGKDGHWGHQTGKNWRDWRWNLTDSGSTVAGALLTVPEPIGKALSLRLGDKGELSACFDMSQGLKLAKLWSGPFVAFDAVRFGLLGGVRMAGKAQPLPANAPSLGGPSFVYRGYYRNDKRVIFSYAQDGVEMLASPWVANGEFTWTVCPANAAPLRDWIHGGPVLWPKRLITQGHLGKQSPYAIDTIDLPFANPWHAQMFVGDHDFFANGDIAVCTIMGDVWRVSPEDTQFDHFSWKRFATGLHQPLGLKVINDQVHVLGRDQITRLHDLNGDGEADFYECVNNAYLTSAAGHDFITGLDVDAQGRFYFASANQGVCRVSPNDRSKVEVIATGLRNPDGLALGPNGEIFTSSQEGDWTPACMICEVQPGGHYGLGGPQPGPLGHAPPLCYLPRGLDHSTGGGVFATSARWGPLSGQLIQFSYGECTHMLVLREKLNGVPQGMVMPLPGEFESGVHRGRFSPVDGQLYVSGTRGWQSYGRREGCLQRVRYTGHRTRVPIAFEARDNGILLRFNEPLKSEATELARYFAQQWNYRYSAAYGSPEFSVRHPTQIGHDRVAIQSVHLLDQKRTLFIEIPQLQPVQQLHLHADRISTLGEDFFFTLHALGPAFTSFPGYRAVAKEPIPDAALAIAASAPNPWRKPSPSGGRHIELSASTALHFLPDRLTVQHGEPLTLTFRNPDVVPHNFVLLARGSLTLAGEAANRMVSEPEALARHYVPDIPEVLSYTDMVASGGEQTIHFTAPVEPGEYPFMCSFPGHWTAMHGIMSVQ